MIVWINGPFGIGKSTTARALAEVWTGAIEFDPEHLGCLLRRWYPPDVEVDDFQDLAVWRRLVRETAAGLIRDFDRPLIVPMTLLNPECFDEIVGGLRGDGLDVRAFCLLASKDVVLRRATQRGDDTSWAKRKYDEYGESLADTRFGDPIDTTDRPADVVVQHILAGLPHPLPRRASLASS